MSNVYICNTDCVLYLLDDCAHLHTQLGVKVGQRLIHQQHVRLYHKRARKRNALLLTAGEPVRHTVGILPDMHKLHKLVSFPLDILFCLLAVFQAESDVIPYAQVRKNRIVLEYHADIALGWRYIIDSFVIEVKITAFNAVESRDHSQKSRLPTSRWTKKGEKFTLLDVQRQIRNDCIVTVFFYGVFDRNTNTHDDFPYSLILFPTY